MTWGPIKDWWGKIPLWYVFCESKQFLPGALSGLVFGGQCSGTQTTRSPLSSGLRSTYIHFLRLSALKSCSVGSNAERFAFVCEAATQRTPRAPGSGAVGPSSRSGVRTDAPDT